MTATIPTLLHSHSRAPARCDAKAPEVLAALSDVSDGLCSFVFVASGIVVAGFFPVSFLRHRPGTCASLQRPSLATAARAKLISCTAPLSFTALSWQVHRRLCIHRLCVLSSATRHRETSPGRQHGVPTSVLNKAAILAVPLMHRSITLSILDLLSPLFTTFATPPRIHPTIKCAAPVWIYQSLLWFLTFCCIDTPSHFMANQQYFCNLKCASYPSEMSAGTVCVSSASSATLDVSVLCILGCFCSMWCRLISCALLGAWHMCLVQNASDPVAPPPTRTVSPTPRDSPTQNEASAREIFPEALRARLLLFCRENSACKTRTPPIKLSGSKP